MNHNMDAKNTLTVIQIPRTARNWRLHHVPVSTRLRTVLFRRGYRRLGDLHELPWNQLFRTKGCGVRCISDLEGLLERLDAGEFDKHVVLRKSDRPGEVVKIIDAYCDRVRGRNRRILLARLGATHEPVTLAEVGGKHGLTRERVRQIVDSRLEELSRAGGPPFLEVLRNVLEENRRSTVALTLDQLSKWLGSVKSNRYPIRFYARMIHQLRGGLPRK